VNLGAEPKKLAILGAVVVIGAVIYFMNGSGDSPSTASTQPVLNTAPVGAFAASGKSTAATRKLRLSPDFRLRVGPARPEEAEDPATIDPELKLDLLAKVLAVEPIEAGRNLFQFGAAPPPEAKLPPVPPPPAQIHILSEPRPSASSGPTGPVAAVTPPPPPINLKYFGVQRSYSNGHKVAFLMDGEEIVLVEENQTVKQRYRIVRIDFKSIVIEDMQAKSTQTLQLQELPPA
jgi:hypothetical protein